MSVQRAAAQFVPPPETRSAETRSAETRNADSAKATNTIRAAEPEYDVIRPVDSTSLRYWLRYAYLVADPTDALDAMLLAEEEGLLTEENFRIFGVLLASLANSEQRRHGPPADIVLDTWVSEGLRSPLPFTRRTLFTALWWASDGPSERLGQVVESLPPSAEEEAIFWARLIDAPAPDLTTIDLASGGVIDLLWAAFAGSGDLRTVETMFAAFPQPGEPAQPDDPEQAARSRLLALGLVANGHQHPRVLDMLREKRAAEPRRWSTLDQVIGSIEARLEQAPPSLPPTNGNAGLDPAP